MKLLNLVFLSYIILITGCATTNVVLLDETKKYPPTKSVQILNSIPNRPYEVIAQLETRESVGQSLPNLLESMREKAKFVGADAIIPIEEGREKLQQGFIYNPWLGGYQTIVGGQVPILRGYAIVFLDSRKRQYSNYNYTPPKTFTGGASFNFALLALNGYGGSIWFGGKKIRFVTEIFKFDIPNTFYRDNFEKDKLEEAYRFSIDYFFIENLSSVYFPVGIEYWKISVGHKYTSARGNYEMVFISVGLGYLLRFNNNLYFDSRFSLNASLSQETEILVGGWKFVPDKAGYSAFLGFGFNF